MFINGLDDPWSPLCVTKSPGELNPVYNIMGKQAIAFVFDVYTCFV
jgi:hypothetical protein